MPPLSSPRSRFPFVPRSLSSGYSASCSSFQPSIGSASQGLSQRPDPFFRPDQIFPVPCAWFPVRISRFCLFSFPVCSLSLFPASLPQPFHRCSSFLPVLPFHPLVRPCVRSLRFHPGFPVFPLRSRPVRTPLLDLCFFLSLLQASASQWLPLCRSALRSPSFPQAPFLRHALGSCLRFLRLSASAPRFLSPLGSLPRFVFHRFLRFLLASFRSRPFPVLFGLGTRFCCSSFHRSRFRLTAATSFRLPSLSGSGLPLSFLLPLRFLRFRLSSVRFRFPFRSLCPP